MVAEDLRGRILTFVNSGASYGVALAGVALAATVCIARLLPAGGPASDIVEENGVGVSFARPRCARLRRFSSPASARLFSRAFVALLSTRVYWTFAVDLIAGSGSAPRSTGEAFFVLVGASGLVGGLGGDLIRRFGLRPVLLGAVLSLAGSICVLPLASYRWSSAPAILASGVLFGGAFFVTMGLLVVWSTEVFGERPSRPGGDAFRRRHRPGTRPLALGSTGGSRVVLRRGSPVGDALR